MTGADEFLSSKGPFTAMMLAILISLKDMETVESLPNGFATHSGVRISFNESCVASVDSALMLALGVNGALEVFHQ